MKRCIKILSFIIMVFAIALASACNGKEKVEKIEVKSNPIKTLYEINDNLDLNGGVITVYIKGADSKEISMTDKDVSYIGYDKTKTGVQTITITYSEKNATFPVEVQDTRLASISVKSNPTKMEYFKNESLNLTGGIIVATKANGSIEEISMTSNDISATCDLTTVGTKSVTLTYQGKTTTFSILVKENTVTSISVKSNPTKIKYFKNESLVLTGGVILATKADGGVEEVSMTHSSVTATCDLTTAGTKTVTITYQTKTTTFNITVNEIEISSIAVKTIPAKTTYYDDEELDLTGGVINVTFNNGQITEVAMTSLLVNATGFDNTVAGTNIVTLTYQEKTTTINLTIKDVAVEASEVEQLFLAILEATELTYEDIALIDEAILAYQALEEKPKAYLAEDYDEILGYKYILLLSMLVEEMMALEDIDINEDLSNIDEFSEVANEILVNLKNIIKDLSTLEEYSYFDRSLVEDLKDIINEMDNSLAMLEQMKNLKTFFEKIESDYTKVTLEDKDSILFIFELFITQSEDSDMNEYILSLFFPENYTLMDFYSTYLKTFINLAFAGNDTLLDLFTSFESVDTTNVNELLSFINEFFTTYDALSDYDHALFDEYLSIVVEFFAQVREEYKYYDNALFNDFILLIDKISKESDYQIRLELISDIQELLEEMPEDLLIYITEGAGSRYYLRYLSELEYTEAFDEIEALRKMLEDLYYINNLTDFKNYLVNKEKNLLTYQTIYYNLSSNIQKMVSDYNYYVISYENIIESFYISIYNINSVLELIVLMELLDAYPEIMITKIDDQFEYLLSQADSLISVYQAIEDLPDSLTVEHYELVMNIYAQFLIIEDSLQRLITNLEVLEEAISYIDFLMIEENDENVIEINNQVLALETTYQNMSILLLNDLFNDLQNINFEEYNISNYIHSIYNRHVSLYHEFLRYEELNNKILALDNIAEENRNIEFYTEVVQLKNQYYFEDEKYVFVPNYTILIDLLKTANSILTGHFITSVEEAAISREIELIKEIFNFYNVNNYALEINYEYFEIYFSLIQNDLKQDFITKFPVVTYENINDMITYLDYLQSFLDQTDLLYAYTDLLTNFFNNEISLLPEYEEYTPGDDLAVDEKICLIKDLLNEVYSHIPLYAVDQFELLNLYNKYIYSTIE